MDDREGMDLPQGPWRAALRRRLLTWFKRHQRDLPWRRTRDPYAIWVSEIMLQQTQVATVESYFERFLTAFPTVAALAAAPEERVLRLWEGLGYYRRARQMQRAAQIIMAEHGGTFPQSIEVVRSLPGIGRYTAGAIVSIAFDQPEPIVEANTFRLFARLLAYRDDPRAKAGTELLWAFAASLLPSRQAGQVNQALMELGSLVCVPRVPRCEECPVASLCRARAEGVEAQIPPPVRAMKFEAVRAAAIVVLRDDETLLVRPPAGERWAGLWDFPRFEFAPGKESASDAVAARTISRMVFNRTGLKVRLERPLTTLKHGVTRFRITLDAWLATVVGGQLAENDWTPRWVKLSQLEEYPLSTTGRKLAQEAMLLAGTDAQR